MSRPNMRAHFARENARHAWMAQKPEPRPVQRIPPHDPQQIARGEFFSDMLRAGWDDEDAHELTVERFAIADHQLLGAIRNEE